MTAEETRASIVAWMRKQAAMWNRLAAKAEKGGNRDVMWSQIGIAASYADHADAVERGADLW